MDLEKLAIPVGTAVAAGIGAAFVAPMVAGKIVATTDPKNWWAPGAVALVVGGCALAYGLSQPFNSDAAKFATFAGASIAGVGSAFGILAYLAKQPTSKSMAGLANIVGASEMARRQAVMGNLVQGNLAMGNIAHRDANAAYGFARRGGQG